MARRKNTKCHWNKWNKELRLWLSPSELMCWSGEWFHTPSRKASVV